MAEIVLDPEVIEVPEPDISHIVTEDDTPVDNIFSEKQMRLLTETLYTSWDGPAGEGDRSFIALANVGLFYAVKQPPLVPDVLVSLDVTLPDDLWEKRHRSYFIWEYGKPPDVVIEIVSNQVGNELGKKKQHYANLGIAYYIVYDLERQLTDETLHLFGLERRSYVPLEEAWFPELGLGLTLWDGAYEGTEATWLRWCDADGTLLPTGAEAARAAEQRAERLAEQLREAGIEPEA